MTRYMGTTEISNESPEPIFVSVKQAAQMLSISPWSCYQLLDSGAVVARYAGRRRLVEVESIRAYAKTLPTERPEASA